MSNDMGKRFKGFNEFSRFNGFNRDGAAHKNQKRRGVSIMAMPEGFFENRFPVLSFPNIDCLTANDKDFSLRSK